MPPPQAGTWLKLDHGTLILTGREDVENEHWKGWSKGIGLVISAAGERTEQYKYPDRVRRTGRFRFLVVPVSFNHRDRTKAWGTVATVLRSVASQDGYIAADSVLNSVFGVAVWDSGLLQLAMFQRGSGCQPV